GRGVDELDVGVRQTHGRRQVVEDLAAEIPADPEGDDEGDDRPDETDAQLLEMLEERHAVRVALRLSAHARGVVSGAGCCATAPSAGVRTGTGRAAGVTCFSASTSCSIVRWKSLVALRNSTTIFPTLLPLS